MVLYKKAENMGVRYGPKNYKSQITAMFFFVSVRISMCLMSTKYFNLLRNKETIEKGQTTIFASWSGFSMLNFLK